VKLIFCRRHSLGSWAIRFFTWSPWSHCVIVEDAEHGIDSTFAHGGVRRRLLSDILAECSRAVQVEVRAPDEAAALDFARLQLGKPYDWTAIVGFIVQRNWAEPDAWFCNELAEASLVAGGRPRWRSDLNRITPRDSWAVLG
jgi:uncharacterized protein YycO